MGLLSRFKESSAIKAVQAAMQQGKPSRESADAAKKLAEVGTQRCVPILCQALFQNMPNLQIQAAKALAAIYGRVSDQRILKDLNSAVLNERQSADSRQAIIESLASIVDYRHARSLVEVLHSNRSPLGVRAAALRCLKKLNYPEVLERLVECCYLGKRLDTEGKIRQWAVRELKLLDDREKLTKLFEIAHGRRKLRHRSITDEAGGVGLLVLILARIDPKGSQRFLNQMLDDANPAIAATAKKVVADLKKRQAEA